MDLCGDFSCELSEVFTKLNFYYCSPYKPMENLINLVLTAYLLNIKYFKKEIPNFITAHFTFYHCTFVTAQICYHCVMFAAFS